MVHQVGILQGSHAHDAGYGLLLVVIVFPDRFDGLDPRPGVVGHQRNQVLQLHDPALAGLEGFSVLPVHRPETVVFQARRLRCHTRLVSGLEDLPEVLLLPVVDHVEHVIRVVFLHALVDGRQVGRAVEHRAVGFFQHQRRDRFPVSGFFHFHDQGAPAFPGVAFLLQPRDQTVNAVLRVTLSEPQIEADVQLFVALPEVIDGHVTEVLPQSPVTRTSGLEFHRGLPRGLGEIRVVFFSFAGLWIQFFQIGDTHRWRVRIGSGCSRIEIRKVRPAAPKALDNESHLQAPVAQVHVADHLVADEAADPHDALSDDRGAEVADVERFGHVGTTVIDDDPARSPDGVTTQPFIPVYFLYVGGDEFVFKLDIDESRSGEGQAIEHFRRRDGFHHVLRDLSGVGPVLFGRRKRAITLELAQVRPVGNPHFAIASVIAGRFKGVREHDRKFIRQCSHEVPFRLDCRRW